MSLVAPALLGLLAVPGPFFAAGLAHASSEEQPAGRQLFLNITPSDILFYGPYIGAEYGDHYRFIGHLRVGNLGLMSDQGFLGVEQHLLSYGVRAGVRYYHEPAESGFFGQLSVELAHTIWRDEREAESAGNDHQEYVLSELSALQLGYRCLFDRGLYAAVALEGSHNMMLSHPRPGAPSSFESVIHLEIGARIPWGSTDPSAGDGS